MIALMRKIRDNGIRVRLYNRLIISYTLIFVLAIYAFAFVAVKYYTKFESIKNLQQSNSALHAVCNYYSLKQDELPNTILPIFQTDSTDFGMNALFSTTDKLYTDPIVKMGICEMLQKIVERDGDIKEILLYRDSDKSKYVYLRENKTIDEVGAGYPFFDIMASQKSGRIITGTQGTGIGDIVNSNAVYGIGGIIGAHKDIGVEGRFLIAYNTEALDRVLQNYSGIYGRFVLASLDGDVIYDSEGNYNAKKFRYMEELLSGNESALIEGNRCYIQTIVVQKASVIGANIVPVNALDDKRFIILVYGVFLLIVLVCGALYIIGGQSISKRVNGIVFAMKRVGANNLTYRIPTSKQRDEFDEIAVKFNEMCDEMQETIDREYISEIKKKNAELESLQTGINPHFLYNTLEVIRIRAVDSGNADVGKMIVDLANLYRSIIKNRTIIPIRNAISNCDIYVELFSYPYGKNLEYETNIEPAVMKLGIPKNLLQPIIENYFVHGIKVGDHDNRFTIRGFLKNEDICFVFEDNGRGISNQKLEEMKNSIKAVNPEAESGYGLLNVQRRIRLIYGDEYGITLTSEENTMTRITVLIKAMTCEELEASLKRTF